MRSDGFSKYRPTVCPASSAGRVGSSARSRTSRDLGGGEVVDLRARAASCQRLGEQGDGVVDLVVGDEEARRQAQRRRV